VTRQKLVNWDETRRDETITAYCEVKERERERERERESVWNIRKKQNATGRHHDCRCRHDDDDDDDDDEDDDDDAGGCSWIDTSNATANTNNADDSIIIVHDP